MESIAPDLLLDYFGGVRVIVMVDHCMDSEVRMLHRRVQSAKLPRLLFTVIGLSLLGIACQNPLQAPPTFQDKFNKIELTSNETSGMTLTEVREIFGVPGESLPLTPREQAFFKRIDPKIRLNQLSRYEWAERQASIIVLFYFGFASIKTFTTSR